MSLTGENESVPRIVVLDGGYEGYPIEEAVLKEAGCTLDAFEGGRHDVAGKRAFAQGAIGLLVRWSDLDGPAFDAMPSVKYVVRYGVGYDNVDLEAASARGILVSNVRGYADHSVSDHALALILACVRGLRPGMERFEETYGGPPRPRIPELRAMTLGIVGLGGTGGTLCKKAQGLFQRVLASDPYIPAERFEALGAVPCDLDTVLAQSDVVSIHCNLTDETRLLFDRAVIAKMRPTAILVNTSRGPVVDEEALFEALESDRLHAAGLDVFWDEPPQPNRAALLASPRVVATGHYAYFSNDASEELQRRAAENMATLIRGEIPQDCLNPQCRERSQPDRHAREGP